MIRYETNNSSNNSYNNRRNYLNDKNNSNTNSDYEKSEIVNLSGYLIYLTINYNGNVKLYGKNTYTHKKKKERERKKKTQKGFSQSMFILYLLKINYY
jgi:hypothetical protein